MRSRIPRVVAVLIVTVSAFASASSHARADTASAARSTTPLDAADIKYRSAVDLAFEEFAAGNYAEARARFLEAHAIKPNARVLRALGMVEYELRNYALSLAYLEQALRSHERPLVDDERAEAEQLRQRAREYLALFTLNIQPPDADVALDGEPLAAALSQPLWLAVGDHVLEVRAKGYNPVRRELHVQDRSEHTLSIELQPRMAASPSHTTAPQAALAPSMPTDRADPLYARPWFWVGAFGLAVGAAIAVAAVAGASTPYEVQAPSTTRQTPPGALKSPLAMALSSSSDWLGTTPTT